jgi:hypothetical protein
LRDVLQLEVDDEQGRWPMVGIAHRCPGMRVVMTINRLLAQMVDPF